MVPTALGIQKTQGFAECMQGLICDGIWTFGQNYQKLGAEFVIVRSSRSGTNLPLPLINGKLPYCDEDLPCDQADTTNVFHHVMYPPTRPRLANYFVKRTF